MAKASNEMMAKLRTAIVNVIGTTNNRRAIELIFESNDEGKDVDPMVQTLVRKVDLMRRTIDKFPDKETTYVDNVKYSKNISKEVLTTSKKLTCRTPTATKWAQLGCSLRN